MIAAVLEEKVASASERARELAEIARRQKEADEDHDDDNLPVRDRDGHEWWNGSAPLIHV